MEQNSINPTEDLRTIRNIMEQSSKFLSLSGLAGVFAGICALAGTAIAWFMILQPEGIRFGEYTRNANDPDVSGISMQLAAVAIGVLITAVLGAVWFSYRKARKSGLQVWNGTSRRLILHLSIPLVTGALFILILVSRNNLGLVAPAMLIFYGLSLINAGKFTLGEIHYLGLTQIALGILAALFPDQGMLFWMTGFGIMHIVYGTVMYFRYER